MENKTSEIRELFAKTREQTLALCDNLEPEDMVIQPSKNVSPLKWHLGHTTWFFEKFILLEMNESYKPYNKDFNYIFNSYYNSVGEYNPRNKRGSLNRPLYSDVIKYRNYVTENILDFFNKSQNNKISFLVELGSNHEQQHQELMLMDIKNIFFNNPLMPTYNRIDHLSKTNTKNEFSLFNTQKFTYGNDQNVFCYDNELPATEANLEPFKIYPFVTNGEWKEFINDGGYKKHEFWLSDGWDFVKENKLERPMYWIDENNSFTLNGVKEIDSNKPVSHISFYEADAFARYKNKRLPSEFELEYFLKKSEKKGNFLEDKIYNEIVEEADSAYGNLWAWSNSNYLPYKKYKAYEGNLGEYNNKFMCNQFVLKGGSHSTSKKHIRASYRNFFYPSDTWQFCGVRLADDI
tara:strand:- start:209 stop:1426 length:1218 start_codon:yes stop_codon:yes gene_type:complete